MSERDVAKLWASCSCGNGVHISADKCLCAEIKDLRRQLREATEWRSMESAPKDGEPFFFKWPSDPIEGVNIVHWHQMTPDHDPTGFVMYDGEEVIDAEHGEWLPIPGVGYGEGMRDENGG